MSNPIGPQPQVPITQVSIPDYWIQNAPPGYDVFGNPIYDTKFQDPLLSSPEPMLNMSVIETLDGKLVTRYKDLHVENVPGATIRVCTDGTCFLMEK